MITQISGNHICCSASAYISSCCESLGYHQHPCLHHHSGLRMTTLHRPRRERKDVVIIGNGPSAITLSYMLSGHWPYYAPQEGPHQNPYLEARLRKDDASSPDISLVEHDLELLCSGLEGRSINPVSVLVDTLQHPEADFGLELPSCLDWRYEPKLAVDHVVLGKGRPGGSWDAMADCTETLTVSFGDWMQLPNMCIKQWNSEHKRSGGTRISLGSVAKYYKDYVKRQGLEKYFQNSTTVTKVHYDTNLRLWRVFGWQDDKGPFEYVTPKVVLATGNSDSPSKLGVPGEDLPFVLHSVTQLEHVLSRTNRSKLKDPIVIIGAGLSAADAVIACSYNKVQVRHIFRRHPDDPSLIFNQLPESIYPEYHDVHAGMKDDSDSHNYKSLPMHTVAEIRNNREVVLLNMIAANDAQTVTRRVVKASYVLVLIGKKPNIQFMRPGGLRQSLAHNPLEPINPRSNPISIDPFTHQSTAANGLYAMGPLVGDNFVRFVQGAALAIVSHIWKERREQIEAMASAAPLQQVES